MSKIISAFLLFGVLTIPSELKAHCEIPCGIYGDEAKFQELDQHAATIEKAVTKISELEDSGGNSNQLVRWINNKEEHANKIKEEVTGYFLSQRIKFPADESGRVNYLAQLEAVHKITVYAMKAKQTVDLEVVAMLKQSIADYHELYDGHSHS